MKISRRENQPFFTDLMLNMKWNDSLLFPTHRLLHTNNEEKFFLRPWFAFAPCDVSNDSYKNNRSDVGVLVLKQLYNRRSEQFSARLSYALREIEDVSPWIRK